MHVIGSVILYMEDAGHDPRDGLHRVASPCPGSSMRQTSLPAKFPIFKGPLIIDEAIEAAKSILNGNNSSVLLVLLPHHRGSTPAGILKNRRLLEDKLIGFLG